MREKCNHVKVMTKPTRKYHYVEVYYPHLPVQHVKTNIT